MENKIYKFWRYLITGYLFERPIITHKLKSFTSEKWDNLEYELEKPLVVYTAIFGKYDGIQPATTEKNVCSILFTDMNIDNASANGWTVQKIPDEINNSIYSNVDKNRYLKMHPERLFPGFEYSLYIDGNIAITGRLSPIINKMNTENRIIAMHRHSVRNCTYAEGRAIYALGKAKFWDIWKQLHRYRLEGFPSKYGLFENNIIFRRHNDCLCKKIMNIWWEEYITGCKRDQLSFMYSLWKNDCSADFVLSLGSNSRNNPIFKVYSHK